MYVLLSERLTNLFEALFEVAPEGKITDNKSTLV